MEDRLYFHSTRITNGIKVHLKDYGVPFVLVHLIVPLGSAHNNGTTIPFGSVHFLEHLVCGQSMLFPKHNEFAEKIAKLGGYFNAYTDANTTHYILEIRNQFFEELFPLFVSHVLSPLITEEQILKERGIILNEINQESMYFPARNKYGHYFRTEWKNDVVLPLRNTLGSKEDLELLMPDSLMELHKRYYSKDMTVIVGGDFNHDVVYATLEKISTQNFPELKKTFSPISWKNKDYHTVACNESNEYIYHLGGIIPSTSVEDLPGLRLLGRLLTDSNQGILYKWLRKELGWSYSIHFDVGYEKLSSVFDWTLELSCNGIHEVESIRANLRQKIESLFTEETYIQEFVETMLHQRCFDFQTIGSVIGHAINSLKYWGIIFTEEEVTKKLHQYTTVDALKNMYAKYFADDFVGEFLAIPETIKA